MSTKIINKKVKAQNRHWKNFLDKDYLGSHNLEAGEEMLLTIERFEGEEMVMKVGGKSDEKVVKQVLYFKEDVPKMIMNITNGTTIAALYGPHPDQWIGKQIQVYATPVKAFGKTQDSLRIRDFKPKTNLNISEWTLKLDEAKTIEQLGTIWKGLPLTVKNDKAIEDYKNTLKANLTKKA
jgi:hypothetical protein